MAFSPKFAKSPNLSPRRSSPDRNYATKLLLLARAWLYGRGIEGLPQIAYRQHEREKGMIRAEAHHPYHEHQLTKVDTRRTYAFCDARWKCDCCQRHLDGTIAEETYAYHCHKCEFDLCQQCYQGSLHPFHQHRLRPANPLLCYGQTEGQWRCDACLRVFSPLTSKVKLGREER